MSGQKQRAQRAAIRAPNLRKLSRVEADCPPCARAAVARRLHDAPVSSSPQAGKHSTKPSEQPRNRAVNGPSTGIPRIALHNDHCRLREVVTRATK